MKTSKARVRRKMTEQEKIARRERKRRAQIRFQIGMQGVIINFHRHFEYIDKDAQAKFDLEAEAAERRYEELEKSL